MRIIFVSYNYKPDQTNPYEWLKRIDFYTGMMEQLSLYAEVINIDVINWKGQINLNGVKHIFFKDANVFSINGFIKKLHPDFLIIHGFYFSKQTLHARLVLNKQTKLVIWHHAEKPAKGLKFFFQKILDKFITAYLFSSKEMAEPWLQKKIINNAKKVFTIAEASSIYQPINKNIAREKTQASGDKIFLWVGRLDENKDPFTVIKAFKRYLKDQPLARLYIIYKSEELINEVKLLKGDEMNIVLLGKVSREDLLYWFNSAEFVICSSFYEGCNISVLEAMSCGCIPIVTNIPSFKLHTNNGKIGFLFKAGSEDELYYTLEKSDSINIQQERSRVLDYFNDELSFAATARKLIQILEGL